MLHHLLLAYGVIGVLLIAQAALRGHIRVRGRWDVALVLGVLLLWPGFLLGELREMVLLKKATKRP